MKQKKDWRKEMPVWVEKGFAWIDLTSLFRWLTKRKK